jgi:L-serine dehydratase
MLSVLDIFKVGIGPSSSHTIGPMKAARQFVVGLQERRLLRWTHRLRTQLFGSLGLTGRGHGTGRAVLLGLEGHRPDTIDPDTIDPTIEHIRKTRRLNLLGQHSIDFACLDDLVFHRDQTLPGHSNGMRFEACAEDRRVLHTEEFYSVGGGFVVRAEELGRTGATCDDVPCPFESAVDLLQHARERRLRLHEVVMVNEQTWRSASDTRAALLDIAGVMRGCIDRGLHAHGRLPGILQIPRRAPTLYRALQSNGSKRPLELLDWVSAFAIAVNEENAAGGRVVTAPTNGAAGIVPAVLEYYRRFEGDADEEGVLRFLLVAGAIAILYKKNASISGADMGCQGEVGVACSMAAAGLTAALNGSNEQAENAAEIGMEHNLGLTCDPVGGLVQIPCIERNAIGAGKAIHASNLALRGDGSHKVTLDQVIATMRQTGLDMKTIYKETSQGGLAVNVPEC